MAPQSTPTIVKLNMARDILLMRTPGSTFFIRPRSNAIHQASSTVYNQGLFFLSYLMICLLAIECLCFNVSHHLFRFMAQENRGGAVVLIQPLHTSPVTFSHCDFIVSQNKATRRGLETSASHISAVSRDLFLTTNAYDLAPSLEQLYCLRSTSKLQRDEYGR
jgi:hypothetical protein